MAKSRERKEEKEEEREEENREEIWCLTHCEPAARGMGGDTPHGNTRIANSEGWVSTNVIESKLHCLPLLLAAMETSDHNYGMLEPDRIGSQSLRRLLHGS